MRVFHCGSQHHFLVECRFHLATFIDDYLISTVGDYWRDGKRQTIGSGRYFETFVFKTDNDWSVKTVDGDQFAHPVVADWSEIDTLPANTALEAAANHERMVAKYLSMEPAR